MGNCLPSQGSGSLSADFIGRQEFMTVTRSDGKIIESTAPLVVRDVLAAYPQHSVVHSEDATGRFLSPNKKLVPRQLYRLPLVPNSLSLSEHAVFSKAKSIDHGSCAGRVSSPSFPVECVQVGSGITRVKMVITKRELETFLSDCCMEENSLLLQLQCMVAKQNQSVTRRCSSGAWRPSLGGIPELS